ncbi:hypothetical protein [Afipia clevelandensis]|uniref:Uncharacterized protein n=1 Tax=Afipia clevelandensis ATCC 49720 TaxID=883079 RepID=K8PA95_9BRAD|nr:hypothetical protein [Afipia clevelandensis]EKS37694.1 hypothetical protein HMPREF9696_01644 [Afipia clevelandensis ATCC 49720]
MTTRTTSPAQTPRTQEQPAPKPGGSIIETSPLAWVAKLAKRLLAQSLNMPEPLLHHTGVFVFAHVQAAEDRALKTLCPLTLLRQFLAQRRKP